MSDKEINRAKWTAGVAMAYASKMSDAERLSLLNAWYDVAFMQGQNHEASKNNESLRSDIAALTARVL